METVKRTIVKTISYRLTAFFLTVVCTWFYTNDIGESTIFSAILHLLLSLDYYIHERIWLKIRWGRL